MDNFQVIKEIGAGSFANVFRAVNKENKEIVAIKRLK
jgi:protein kinase